jgi:hypothetical protein
MAPVWCLSLANHCDEEFEFMSKRIDAALIVPVIGTDYPAPFDQRCRTRERRKLGDQANLTQFGVNLLRLIPGAWSSQRHWHTGSDEFVYVISGEVVLVSDDGEEMLRAGDAAGFKAGDATVTACKIVLTVMPASWRSAHALRLTSGTTRILTWWRLQTGARCLIRIETARPLRHRDGEGPAVMSGAIRLIMVAGTPN